jgi:predicted ArsR family transcriptional regulator
MQPEDGTREGTEVETPSELDGIDAQILGIAALAEPIRRRLYRFVVAQGVPVSREEAATGADVAHHVAKFHLDKLVDDGLLEVEYSRPPGRGGPGAGRPAKRYRRSSSEVAVSLPQRHYELAGRLLAGAVVEATSDGAPVDEALSRGARDAGRALGQRVLEVAGPDADGEGLVAATLGVLSDCGYEPRTDGCEVTMANCPFHALAQDYTELVCGMNLELMRGLLDGPGRRVLDAHLDPGPDRCCVRLRSVESTTRLNGGSSGLGPE